jgi:hypothetical protein
MKEQKRLLIFIFFCALTYKASFSQSLPCGCDSLKAKAMITDKNFNRIPKYDTTTFKIKDFYELDKDENRKLWYRDIENIDTTKFTSSWNDYARSNYHASHFDFIKFYEDKNDIILAFQFGPNLDLWAYHIFVVKKIDCCFLITRSYFRHARFTYKAYAIISKTQLDSMYTVIEKTNKLALTDKEVFSYRGYFIDNLNKRKFYIDFENEILKTDNNEQEPKPEIIELYNFVDKIINWTKTYSL